MKDKTTPIKALKQKQDFMKRVIYYVAILMAIFLCASTELAMAQKSEGSNRSKNYSANLITLEGTGSELFYNKKEVQDTVKKPLLPLDTQANKKAVIHLGDEMIRTPDQLTAAVSMVGAKELSKTQLNLNTQNTLFGQLNGLTVLHSGGGNPPAGSSLFIRGRSTFSSSEPLILIDGFERPLESVKEIGGLAVDEIQNITVLKDAAGLAKYGQRGANGVILVTTKRGQDSDLGVSVSYEQGITQPKGMTDMANSLTYARAINEARANDNLLPQYSSTEIQSFQSGDSPYLYPNVNWFDQVLRQSGTRSNLNVGVDGGSGRARYFVMGNFIGDNGIFGPVNKNQDYTTQTKYRRFNYRSNIDIDITDKLLFQTDVYGNIVEHNIPGGGGGTSRIFNGLYSIPSAAFPVRNPDGSFGGTQQYDNNPVGLLTSTGFGQPNSRQFSVTGRLSRDMSDILEGLRAELAISYFNLGDFSERKTENFSYKSISPVRNQADEIVDTTQTTYGQDTNLRFFDAFDQERQFTDVVGKVNYRKKWSENNILDAMLRFHQSSRSYEGQDNVFNRLNYAGNIHLGFSQKYFFDISASYSGNNFLKPGDRFGFFPAVSAAWLLSHEDFLKNSAFLSRFKLRASWGLTGSDNLPTNNIYEQSYPSGIGYRFTNGNNYQGGYYEGRIPTSDLRFETSQKTNIGIDATFFSKLDITADAFYDQRTNILTESGGRISDVIGKTPAFVTNGEVINRGIETTINWRDNTGKLNYNIGGGISFARNKIGNINEQNRPYDYLRRTGQQVDQQFGLEAVGFFQDQQEIDNNPQQAFSEVRPGDVKYKDQNDDGIINSQDQVPIGYSTGYPELYFSFSFDMHYQGFGVSALFQGTGNYTAYLNTPSVFWPLRGSNTISEYYYNRRWTAETANQASLPRLTSQENNNNFQPSSLWLVDRSYIKLRNIEVSYSLPTSVVQSLNIQGIRIYARGLNLFSIDDISVMDPEQISAGYPLMRTYSMGLQMKF